MALDFDFPPLYDTFVKTQNQKAVMGDTFRDWLSPFVQTLTNYLTSGGIFLPQLTTAQRDALDSPINGQMIYNTTIDSAQYFKAGSWTSF